MPLDVEIGSEDSVISGNSSEVEWGSSSEMGESFTVSTDVVCRTLLKALITNASCYAEVNLSLSRISQTHAPDVLSAILVFLESTFSLRPRERLLVYESVADSVVPHIQSSENRIPVARIRAFILRVVGDIEKLSSVESDPDRISVPVTKMSTLIASMAMASFGDLVVDVLLTSEFVYGKPTIQNVTVQEALIDIFKTRVNPTILQPHLLHSVMLKLANVPLFAINYPVISAIARGTLNCFQTTIIPEETASLIPIILDSVLNSTDGEISRDSLESLLLLVALLGESASTLPITQQLSQAVLTIGTKGIETEDLREIFLVAVEIIWTHNVPIFDKDNMQTTLFNTILDNSRVDPDSLRIWGLYPQNDATEFLCEICRSANQGTAIRALSQIAIAKKESLSSSVLSYIESVILSGQEKSFGITSRGMINVLDLIAEIDVMLIHQRQMILQFLLRMVLNPSTIISDKFPNGVLSNDLKLLRQSGARALTSVCVRIGASQDEEIITQLALQLIECIEHMPTRGVGILCRCISSLLSGDKTPTNFIPDQSQAVIVIIWILVSLHTTNPEDDHDDLKEDILAGHRAIISIQFGKELPETFANESISNQFAHLVDSLSHDSESDFYKSFRETIMSILCLPSTVPMVRALLIEIWSVVALEPLSSEESATSPIVELLDCPNIITCSPECIDIVGNLVGEFASTSAPLMECIRERFAAISTQLTQLGGAESFLEHKIRLSKKSSLGGLFTSEATEKQIQTLIRMRQIYVIAFAKIVNDSDQDDEFITETLLDELEREHDAIIACDKNFLSSIPASSLFETTIIVLKAISDSLPKSRHTDDILFAIESCLEMVESVGGANGLVGPLLKCLSALLAVETIEISSEMFANVLETTLEAIVQTVPDNAILLNSLSSESSLLTERCSEAALVMKSLFRQTSHSWVGLNRLTKAIFALGGGGAIPLIRWVCVRIISIVMDDGGVIESDQDTQEFLDIVSVLIGRLNDSYTPVRIEANKCVVNLLQRWKPTFEETKNDTNFFTSSSLANVLIPKIPVPFVSGFCLGLIANIHDLDPDAAEGTVNVLHNLLETRSSDVFEDENSAADAVVDAIMMNASEFPSPPAPPSHWPWVQSRLVGTLRFIASVRFHIAIKDLLTPLEEGKIFSIDKIHAIKSFILDKKTLGFFVKELITRLNSSDTGGRTACIALGHLLDSFTDSSVSNICKKNFSELYCSLLVHSWFRKNETEEVKNVIQKLMRAAGNIALVGESSTETGLLVFQKSDKVIESSAKFLSPFLAGKNRLVPHVVLVSQLVGSLESVDMLFLDFFENLCERSTDASVSPVEIIFSLKGLERIVSRWTRERDNSLEDTDAHVMHILTFLNTLILSNNGEICEQALITIQKICSLASGESTTYLIHPILGQLKRVVDHQSESVRRVAFDVIAAICNLVDQQEDESMVIDFYRSISDLWISCVVRTQDPSSVELRYSARAAFVSILNNAVRDEPITEKELGLAHDPIKDYHRILEIVKAEIGECSFVHLNACCYYLLGLSSIPPEVKTAAARLVPIVLAMIPEPSIEATSSVTTVINSLLASGLDQVYDVIADILIVARRIDPESENAARTKMHTQDITA